MNALSKDQAELSVLVVGKTSGAKDFYTNLKNMGLTNVQHLDTPQNALECMSSSNPGLLYVVGALKGMNWLSFAQIIRTSPELPFCPAIFVRGQTQVFEPMELERVQKFLFTKIRMMDSDPAKTANEITTEIKEISFNRADKSSTQNLVNKAKDYYQKGLIQKAEEVYKDLLKEFRDDMTVKVGKAECSKFDLENYHKKLAGLLSEDPENYNLKFKMLNQMISDQNMADFKTLFSEMIQGMEAGKEKYWLKQLGDICLRVRIPMFSDQVATILEKNATEEERWEIYIYKARWALSSGDIETADQYAQKAKEMAPEEMSEVFNVIGVVEKRKGNLEGALEAFQSAKKVSSWDYRISFNIALCLKALARIEEARTCLKEILEHNPGYDKALHMLASLAPKKKKKKVKKTAGAGQKAETLKKTG